MKKMMYGFTISMAILVLSLPSIVQAASQEVSDLKETVVKQSEMIDALLGRVKALEEKKYTNVGAMPTSLEEISPKAAWAEKVKIKGDFRYRHEVSNVEGARHNADQAARDARATTRNRQRIRARIGVYAEINDDIDFIFRLASGSDDSPTSTNQTLDTFFTKKHVWIDLAYVTWHPEEFMCINTKGFEAYAGKMKMPFYTPVGSELIWDADMNPEGIAAKYCTKVSGIELCAATGAFWVDEQSRDVDTNLWGIQGYFKAPVINDDIKLVGGLTYYDYGSIRDHSVYGDGSGNSTHSKVLNTATLYQVDYQILEGFTEVHWTMFDMPFIAYAQFLGNMATKDDDNAFQFGAKVNKCKNPGSWQLLYYWQRLEADAVLGALTNGDFGQTDSQGHVFKVGYQLAKHTQLGSALIIGRTGLEDHTGKDFTTFQVDLKVKF